MSSFMNRMGAALVLLCLAFASEVALADDHPYTEGNVHFVTKIRTEPGRFEDYMKFLDTTFKAEMEAFKKAGLILDYQVILAQPHNESEPDLLLVVTYKNWAGIDGWATKFDAVTKQVEGSLDASDRATVDRGKIRRILGSYTTQVLNLK
jgi:hypothetical protein